MKKILLSLLFAVPFLGNAQFTENFDSGTSIPTGWTIINGGDPNTWQIVDFTGGQLGAHSGTNAANIMYNSAAHNDFLVTPAITVTANVSDFLSFWARSRDADYPETIQLKISKTTVTASAFTTTLDANVAPASGADFHKFNYDLTPYIGETIFIGFHSTTRDKFAFDLDDVEVGPKPNCAEPTNFEISTVAVGSASFEWNSPVTNFEIEYGAVGYTPGSGTLSSGTGNSTTVTGLANSTSYHFYLRAVCAATDKSLWVGPLLVQMPCDAMGLPFAEGFNASTIPACWSQETVNGNFKWNFVTANGSGNVTPAEGSRMAEFRNGTDGSKAKLVSPMFDLTGVANPTLKFQLANENWFGDVDELRVFYKTSANGAWTQIGPDYTTENKNWVDVVLALPNPSDEYYIAFEGTSNWARGLNIDDVTVTDDPTQAVDTNGTKEFRYYPNPVKDVLNIETASRKMNDASIYSMDGKLIRNVKLSGNNSQINMSDLQSGVYLVRVKSEGEDRTIRVIKQ